MSPNRYYVWNQNRRLPAIKHATLADAIEEAGRLSEKEPEELFLVLFIIKGIRGGKIVEFGKKT